MEKKTKHRILGTLVVIGIIVILLPFFQSGKSIPPEAKLVKAPPFPDAAIKMTVKSPSNTEAEETKTSLVEPDNQKNQPDDTIAPHRPVENQVVADLPKPKSFEKIEKQPTEKLISNNVNESASTDTDKDKIINSKPIAKNMIHTAKHIARNKSSEWPSSNDVNGLAKLKNAVWVIQIGNFSNKASALHLVNRLRANGYRAFIQQISTALGTNTRVFVGPEVKQSSAFALADRLEKDTHLHGLVISYKPFSL